MGLKWTDEFRQDAVRIALTSGLMREAPGYWAECYSGTDAEVARLMVFSYSDRIRRYWADPVVS